MSNPFDEATHDGYSKRAGDPHANEVTQIIALDDAPPRRFDQAFVAMFDALRQLYNSFPRDGLFCAAVWRGRSLDSYLHMPLSDGPAYAVIGRHARCEIVAPQDQSISLRHIMVGCTRRGNTELRVRLWDLASGIGFRTETDLQCEALVCEGPVFVRLGEYHLFFLPTGSLSFGPWGGDAKQTWNEFPERVLLDQRVPSRSPRVAPSARVRAAGKGKARDTVITQIVPPARPLRAQRRVEQPDEPSIGRLRLSSDVDELDYPVSESDLERGLLIGRYERCHLGAAERRLSRIHLLVVRDGDSVWAIDSASTNGTEHDGQPIRWIRLGGQTRLRLASSLTLAWDASGFGAA